MADRKFSDALEEYLQSRDDLNRMRGHRTFEGGAQTRFDRATRDLDEVWGTLRSNQPQPKQTVKK